MSCAGAYGREPKDFWHVICQGSGPKFDHATLWPATSSCLRLRTPIGRHPYRYANPELQASLRAKKKEHIDIQPRNIMVQIPDLSIIDDYLKNTTPDPAAYDPDSDSWAIVSQPLRDFYIRESTDLMTLDVALCDWGSASWIDNHLTEVIQPVLLRAPEVIIGAPWGPPVDIWNLGAVLLEVLDAVRMFDGRAMQTGGVFQTKHHLEEIVALFGPFPPRLLARGDPKLVAEYFDDQGNIRDPIPRPKALLENWIESLTGNDKEEFVMLLRSMMKIEPDDRQTAKELLGEAWFQHTTR